MKQLHSGISSSNYLLISIYVRIFPLCCFALVKIFLFTYGACTMIDSQSWLMLPPFELNDVKMTCHLETTSVSRCWFKSDVEEINFNSPILAYFETKSAIGTKSAWLHNWLFIAECFINNSRNLHPNQSLNKHLFFKNKK